jgi:glutamyl-tRNA synthetase
VVEDRVQGRVGWQNENLDDFIILRSDGAPTYNFAVVVDDHDMGITHVIRGVDHLTNAARQAQVYQAMDWPMPVLAHVPLIHGADGAKLSKRHGALGVEAYRDMGYLPVALRNYLARLGWSHGDQEVFSTEELIRYFDLDGIGRSAARFDLVKLADLNGRYIRQASDEELLRRIEELVPHLDQHAAVAAKLAQGGRDRLKAALPGLKQRAKTLIDIVNGAAFLFASRPLTLDEKAQKELDGAARARIGEIVRLLETAERWDSGTLEGLVRAYAEKSGLKLGATAQPLRAALTGSTVSPPVFDVMAALGREEALGRLRDQAR